MLTHFRYTITSAPYLDYMMTIKNEVEREGLQQAYLRDGVAFVRHSSCNGVCTNLDPMTGSVLCMVGA
jgi:hypothetical protein